MNIIDPIAKLLGEWSATISVGAIFLRIFLALTLSAMLGCERARKRHSAGLRTFMVVALACTLAGMIDMFLIETLGLSFAFVSVGVVIAVASLSNNSILFTSKNQIKGLTTSVSLWACGLIGLCLGVGFYTIAIVGSIILLCSLSIFPKIERYLKNRSNHFEIHLELDNKNNLPRFMSTIRELGLRIDEIEVNSAYLNSGLSVYTVSLTILSEELKKYKTHAEIIAAINSLEYVKYIEEMR
ncbi:MAG: MgtC/SapB family protein [Clostridiales bacterium]|nr:MgtC/SapB family protein [Clostridiales bacterium]